ncbi:dipeptidase [Natranaerobius thermophilus]|uniref:Membrane dipeptidase n=1 Tax=Natranaerobius thermophilus (strain ATCC BAA-1301 / DSM 18059 / JW/NM-WN-LF) TaxID=457570 RepID=B2A3V9_NATTJ|nr:dipeptidase [Natranaerobius thermophilus]ACB85061.1 Membrane dipeptidase [Natranaerobius thermophilus JW/NM-WN-LF]
MEWQALHDKTFIVDGHSDTILNYDRYENFDFLYSNDNVHMDLPKIDTGGIDLQFFAVFIEDQFLPNAGFKNCVRLLETFRNNIIDSPNFSMIETKKDLRNAIDDGSQKKYGLLTIEGGEVLEGDINLLRALYRLGIRGITLTWNRRNELADGCSLGKYAGGLSDFGCQVVREMSRLGMMVDVSHLSLNSFNHVLEIHDEPVVATHSNASSILNHPRNLDDNQLKKIAESGGVIGLNYASHFITNSQKRAGLDELFQHLQYMINLVGEDHVALGSDFDGISNPPKEINTAADLPKLTEYLCKCNLSETTIQKVLGDNWLRVLNEVLPED